MKGFIYFSIFWLKRTTFIISAVTGLPFLVGGIILPLSCLISVFYCIYNIIFIYIGNSKLYEEIEDNLELKEPLDSIGKNTDEEVGKA